MLVLVTFIPVIIARDKMAKDTEISKNPGTTTETGEDSKNLRSNLA